MPYVHRAPAGIPTEKFVVRLPDGMRERIAAVARSHRHSMNTEIVAWLERSL
ncbi:Arc family DNA-binding protein, partial [Streptomyces sp. EL5]|nr:Arc family DNA-binding protein [Streptomyces sp. EL5]